VSIHQGQENLLQNADAKAQASLLASGTIPTHIAIIMDGNGRWAKKQGNLRTFGHQAGVDSVRDITEACAQLGVKYLTLYAFSTENWKRPKSEVLALMEILIHSLRKEAEYLNRNNIRLEAIGQIERFPKRCINQLTEVRNLTAGNTRLQLTLALSYSGRWDITEAVKAIAREVKAGLLAPDLINDDVITSHLSTADIPDPDLIIRTSGEFRISNFLLWQLAYSELYITKTYWPDFRRNELYEAIQSFQSRDRRFGGLNEQKSEALATPHV
jgi:undecaprenyl diphosphate synthase